MGVNFKDKIKVNMLCKIFILKFLFLNTETKSIIKATEKNFPSFVSLTDGKKRVCDGVILTENAILTSAACAAKPGGKVFYKTFDLQAREVPRSTIVSLQKHRKAKRIKLKNKKGIFKAMPDNIWYHDYQIVKVNPGIEIEDGMITDLGDLDEFQQFVKTKSADCQIVTYTNQNRKLSKKGQKVQVQTHAMAVPANFDRASFDPRYFMKEDVTDQKIFHTRHPTMKKFCGGLPGSPLFCDIQGTQKLFGLRSYQSRACGPEHGWWNPAPIVKFIADNTGYDDPTSDESNDGQKPSSKSKS